MGGFNYINLFLDETIIDFFHTMLVSLIWICAQRSMKKVRKHPKRPVVLGQRVVESLNIKSCENGQFRYHYIWWIPRIPIISILQKNLILRWKDSKPHTLFLNIITQHNQRAEVIQNTIEKNKVLGLEKTHPHIFIFQGSLTFPRTTYIIDVNIVYFHMRNM